MMRRKRVFYFMHVPWNWIKQRPHFLAEQLTDVYDVEVFRLRHYGSKKLTNTPATVKQHNIWRLPLNRLKLLRAVNNAIISMQFIFYYHRFDIIWITTPGILAPLRSISRKKKVIYDCMDDILAFPAVKNNAGMFEEYFRLEREVIELSQIVFCSSGYLKNKLIERYKLTNYQHLHVINNGINIYPQKQAVKLSPTIQNAYDSGAKNLTYIGTISHWFDFEIILNVLNEYKALKVYLFGPAEVKIPGHERLIHFGAIEHSQVFAIMQKAGVLIMPFIVDDLIKSVNPVKAYEYIYSNKSIIMSEYGETEKFRDFVYLYNSEEMFKNIVHRYVNGNLPPKKPSEDATAFALKNTWKMRGEAVKVLMDQLT